MHNDTPSSTSIPIHVAIIMDGNGRWAESKGLKRIDGHKKGAESVREIVTYARELGIRYLTLFAFSSENWGRPALEVGALMELLKSYIVGELSTLKKNQIELKSIGDIKALPAPLRLLLKDAERRTKGLDGMRLTLALSYGSRNEMLRAMKKMALDVQKGRIKADEIDEQTFSSYLDTSDMPDPDLMIRSSGEKRISNFLLWQLAYSELYFTSTAWPDFNRKAFDAALSSYSERQRRFGLTGQQLHDQKI